MREITAATRYIKMADVTAGQVLIEEGKLVQVRPGKFGDTLIFQESNGEEVGLGAGGQLKFLMTKGSIAIGNKYKITFKGKKALKDGRSANDFGVFLYEDQQETFELEGATDELGF